MTAPEATDPTPGDRDCCDQMRWQRSKCATCGQQDAWCALHGPNCGCFWADPTPGEVRPDVCPSCGPGYRYGDEGCRHTPPGEAEPWHWADARLAARDAEVAATKHQRDMLALAMWDVRASFGFDTDGDSRYHTQDFGHVAESFRRDMAEVLQEIEDRNAAEVAAEDRAEAAEAEVAELRARIEAEWFNGNIAEDVCDRILRAALGGEHAPAKSRNASGSGPTSRAWVPATTVCPNCATCPYPRCISRAGHKGGHVLADTDFDGNPTTPEDPA